MVAWATSRRHAALRAESASNRVMDTSFEDFARTRTAGLLRTAFLLTGNQQDAEDLTQDTLLKVHQRWKQVAASQNRSAYVNRMLTNHFLSGKRKRSARLLPLTGQDEVGQHSDFAEQLTERDALAQALHQLPERERAAVVLKHYLRLDSREVAVAMETTESTARSTLSRGIQKLRAELQSPGNPAAQGVSSDDHVRE
jgi:RNA polymerase sigma-70 factor (sigma-E family)